MSGEARVPGARGPSAEAAHPPIGADAPAGGEIVVGYDGTAGARAALTEAIALAGPLEAGLVVAFGYEPTQVGGEMQALRDAIRERGAAVAEEAVALAREAGLTVETAVVDRRPAEALSALAAERGARMIVVGTYGERPFAGAILGATPHRLLHLSEVPVLVVRAAAG